VLEVVLVLERIEDVEVCEIEIEIVVLEVLLILERTEDVEVCEIEIEVVEGAAEDDEDVPGCAFPCMSNVVYPPLLQNVRYVA
jgi:hypothetical protein